MQGIILSMIVASASWLGTPFVLVAGTDTCIPVNFRYAVPEWVGLPSEAELPGIVLPPISGDPNVWEVNMGPFVRKGPFCDPDGDPVFIEIVSGTIPAEITVDPNEGTWTLTATIPQSPRKHLFIVRITDSEAASQDFLIPFVRENRKPVLY